MSLEARLQALVQNYRAQHGDPGLHASTQLIAQLSSQAPDLYGEIRALAAAVTGSAAARIAASPDQDGEAHRVATEIAGAEKLSMAVAAAGVAVARALGPVGGAAAAAMPSSPPAAGGWAGESVAVQPRAAPGGYTPPPPQQPYGQPPAGGYVPPGSLPPSQATPIYQNPIALVAAAAFIAIGGYYYYTQRTAPAPKSGPVANEQGPVAAGPQGGGAPQEGPQGSPGPQGGGAPGGGQQGASGQYPTLARGGDMPNLQVNRMQNGYAIPFLIETANGPAPGGVIVPLNGWDQGPTTVVMGQVGDTTGQGQIINQGSAQMQRVQGPNGPARAGQVQWQQDGLSIGPICVAFQAAAQTPSGDVGLSGTTMCVMDANCQQSAGCGQIR